MSAPLPSFQKIIQQPKHLPRVQGQESEVDEWFRSILQAMEARPSKFREVAEYFVRCGPLIRQSFILYAFNINGETPDNIVTQAFQHPSLLQPINQEIDDLDALKAKAILKKPSKKPEKQRWVQRAQQVTSVEEARELLQQAHSSADDRTMGQQQVRIVARHLAVVGEELQEAFTQRTFGCLRALVENPNLGREDYVWIRTWAWKVVQNQQNRAEQACRAFNKEENAGQSYHREWRRHEKVVQKYQQQYEDALYALFEFDENVAPLPPSLRIKLLELVEHEGRLGPHVIGGKGVLEKVKKPLWTILMSRLSSLTPSESLTLWQNIEDASSRDTYLQDRKFTLQEFQQFWEQEIFSEKQQTTVTRNVIEQGDLLEYGEVRQKFRSLRSADVHDLLIMQMPPGDERVKIFEELVQIDLEQADRAYHQLTEREQAQLPRSITMKLLGAGEKPTRETAIRQTRSFD